MTGSRRLRISFHRSTSQKNPIPAEITELTGITDEMVLGHRINPDAVAAFASDAVIVIAHNASFDRKFAERYWPLFEQKPWACSATEVEWRKHGFDGSRLGYLLAGVGLFHQAHRAIDDCRALIEILASDLPTFNRSGLVHLAGTGKAQDDAHLGRAVAFRTEGRIEEAGLSLERWRRRTAEVLVHRCRRGGPRAGNRVSKEDDLSARNKSQSSNDNGDEPVFDSSLVSPIECYRTFASAELI